MKVPTHAFVGYDAEGIPTELIGDDGSRSASHAAVKYLREGGRVERVTIEDARKVRLYEKPGSAHDDATISTPGTEVLL